MSRRKPAVTKRMAEVDPDFDADTYEVALAAVSRNPPGLSYPGFQTFYNQIRVRYVYGSSQVIPTLEALFPRTPGLKNGPNTPEDFARMLCEWTLYYKSDLVRFKNELIALANAGAELKQLGTRIAESTLLNAGMGLFATRKFKPAQFITAYGGYYCSVDIFELLNLQGREYVLAIPPAYGGGFRDDQVDFRLCDMGRWSNSASGINANAYAHIIEGSSPPAFEIVALREIEVGEEIFWDYGEKMQFDLEPVQCSICEQMKTLSMCSRCEDPICGRSCQLEHKCQ